MQNFIQKIYFALQPIATERPVREWDVGKKHDTLRSREQERSEKDREHGRSRDAKRESERDRDRDRSDRRRRASPEKRRASTSPSPSRKYSKKENDPPLRLLDDLFRKTKTTPCIYWLPLTPEQVSAGSFYSSTLNRIEFLNFAINRIDCRARRGAIETNGRTQAPFGAN